MPLDQDKIADLLPDNTTQQISPQDLRDSFAEVGLAYDGLSVTSIRGILNEDAGDGTPHGDLNATNFVGQAEPDPDPETFITIPDGALVQFFHKGVSYFWAGPSGVSVGVGGDYTAVEGELQAAGVSDHGLLVGRTDPDAHPIGAVTGLQAALDVKSDVGHGHAIADVTDLQTELDARLTTTAWINWGYIKCARVLAEGAGAQSPTIQAQYNVASIVRQAAGVFRITLTQNSFWGVQISEANAMLIPSVKLPSTPNAQVQYLYFVSPGVYDLFIYELNPSGAGGALQPVTYDPQVGDTIEVLGWMDAGDGTLPPA